ncbi:hypothetical protein [Conyzicola sp.]|uniref:hypothetical protein n=1 Tax=Conyzicola sp. TaxID=1969404 RepID=UPI003988BA80
MPSDDDKKSAWIRFEGEAKRLLIRRVRVERDGLFLFGRRHGAQTLTLTATELQALLDGRIAAVDVLGEYLVYVSVEDGAADEFSAATSAVVAEPPRPRYSERVRVRAAQVRVNADRRGRPRVSTPAWIVNLATGHPERER